MNRVLFTENGFCIEWGDRGEEHLNGSLAAALDTRAAPPLLLAIVYQARLPSHFRPSRTPLPSHFCFNLPHVASDQFVTCARVQAVAARLGVELAFCNFPGHVLLRAEGARTASITDGVDGEPQWFVDPAARGRRLLPAQVCDALRRLGMAEEVREARPSLQLSWQPRGHSDRFVALSPVALSPRRAVLWLSPVVTRNDP